MGNVANAFVAQSINGGVYYRAPLGTTQPTDSTTTLNAAFKDQGTCAEDGLSVGITRTSKTIKDFDGADYIDIQEEYNGTFKIKLLDVDLIDAKKTAFGDAKVTEIAADGSHGKRYHVEHSADQLPLSTHVFQVKSGAKRKRYAIEVGRVTELAEIKDVHNDATYLELTIKAFRNSDGNFVEEYGDDGKPTVPANYTVAITGSPTGGTFTLTVGGQTTTGLANNAAASAVQAALVALSTVGAGNATVTGSAGGPYSVTLALGGALTGSGAGLTGGSSPAVVVS
ncbi:hypothetical protein [Gordonia sp. ABSL49_1]|uniref:hypothetical protein n=1 Tax=Gordonia sp. ABSL49_1 TaxID=2920941 RepID=UPI001F0F2F34|nr:hypothetical protein [Gordonia sp. ABSL49_1]MCH5645164.1 hypothetical protein [Gordonia sp. ABSL49_1]